MSDPQPMGADVLQLQEGGEEIIPCSVCAVPIPAKRACYTVGGNQLHFLCAPEQARLMWLACAFDKTMGRLDEFADRLERIFASSVIYVETKPPTQEELFPNNPPEPEVKS